MKIVMISDSHGKQDQLAKLPEADLLIHAGDLTPRGRPDEVAKLRPWFERLAVQYPLGMVVIAGNHDYLFQTDPALAERLIGVGEIPNLHYLNDSGVEVGGIRFWGSPWTPWFFDWAFNAQRGDEIRQHWDMIPDDTRVLVTHGPPKGILDRVLPNWDSVGDQDLLETIQTRLKSLELSVHGHLHESRGAAIVDGVTYVNASMLDHKYRPGPVAQVIQL